MQFVIYRFHFSVGVHFGAGSLWDGMNTLPADTLFSALCHEAAACGGGEAVEQLAAAVGGDVLRLSDLFPFIGEEFYLPKPLCPVSREQEGDSVVKKNFKKLAYIPVSQWSVYLRGKLDPVRAAEQFQGLGSFTMRTMAASRAPEKLDSGDMLPYQVGVYQFRPGNGLYLIAGFAEDRVRQQFEKLLHGLSFSGIGGKRSAGLGRFHVERVPVPEEMLRRMRDPQGTCMALSVCMAEPEELEDVVEGAQYLLLKRSGFVASQDYAPEVRRKRDFYAFRAGSCFIRRFSGNLFDVGGGGAHPVYRYAAALWMEIGRCGIIH